MTRHVSSWLQPSTLCFQAEVCLQNAGKTKLEAPNQGQLFTGVFQGVIGDAGLSHGGSLSHGNWV